MASPVSIELVPLPPSAQRALAELPLRDPHQTAARLRGFAVLAGPECAAEFLHTLGETLTEAADPDMALAHLERWASGLPNPESTLRSLIENPRLLADLLAVTGASDYLAQALSREPWLYSLFLEGAEFRTPGQYERAVASALGAVQKPESRREALRRVKRREFLRIGWRDLARQAPMVETAREISDLADALVRGALQLAVAEVSPRFPSVRDTVRFCVLAMGKLGARELNYSSDVDLMFVLDGPEPLEQGHREFARRVGERLIGILSEQTGEGRCFRVDMRLRPEGRAGTLVRSLAAYREYYDRWAETWERQALIKVRPVAGDAQLGERFVALVRPVTYRRLQGATLLEDVREMRAAVERKLDAAGEMELHVKEGRGTIRDIEFSVQILQLLFGADQPELQVADTWTALQRLHAVGLLVAEELAAFREGYAFFRTVEHRLQLLHDLPVRLIPTDAQDLLRLARSMGFADGEAFRAEYRRQSQVVRSVAEAIQARLGVETATTDPLREAVLSADSPVGAATLREELQRRGFPDVDRALDALTRLAVGGADGGHPAAVRRLFADTADTALEACAAAAEPTLALVGLADLADRKLLHRALYQTWIEHPETLRALGRFVGDAPGLTRLILRYPELSDVVTDPEQWSLLRTSGELRADLEARLHGSGSYQRQLAALRRFRTRELVRLATRHVQRRASGPDEAREWSAVADAVVQIGLETAIRRLREQRGWAEDASVPFAVFALGRFGGEDLHFASDLDLLYVHGESARLGLREFELLAQTFGEVLQSQQPDGQAFPLDLRLRPEGRQGPTVVSLEGARRYYGAGGRAETWEFQALTRLRFVAGDGDLARQFREAVVPRVYRSPMPADWRGEIRAMKRRMETERVHPAQCGRHLKLGPGGFSDIEFLVQYLQLQHGAAEAALRTPSLRAAIEALTQRRVLTEGEAQVLGEAHRLLTDLRQALYLLDPSGPTDLFPDAVSEPRRAEVLARACGGRDFGELQARYQQATHAVRELFLRVFDERVG